MGDLELDTRVAPLGERRYRATLSADWEIWGPNGGYLCAIALRAAGAEASIPRPIALYCHYLRVARFGPVGLTVEPLMRGRRSESLRVTMLQDDKPILEALVRTALAGEGLVHAEVQAPEVPAPEGVPSPKDLSADYAAQYAFWANFDVGVVQPERFQSPLARRPPHFLEWYRVACAAGFDDPFVDAGRTALLLDTIGWPAAVQPHPEHGFVAPSLDVAVWFHASGAKSDWLLAEAHAPVARDGCIAAHGRLFDRDGQLLGTSGTQLFCMPTRNASR